GDDGYHRLWRVGGVAAGDRHTVTRDRRLFAGGGARRFRGGAAAAAIFPPLQRSPLPRPPPGNPITERNILVWGGVVNRQRPATSDQPSHCPSGRAARSPRS